MNALFSQFCRFFDFLVCCGITHTPTFVPETCLTLDTYHTLSELKKFSTSALFRTTNISQIRKDNKNHKYRKKKRNIMMINHMYTVASLLTNHNQQPVYTYSKQ